MNDTPDNKQKRLASLNQDVLAVSPVRGSDAQPRARLQQDRQRFDAASPAGNTAQSKPAAGRGVLIALGGLSIVMLVLLGLVSTILLNMQQRVDRLQAEVATRSAPADSSAELEPLLQRLSLLEKQLPKLQERVVVLEDQPVVVQGGHQADTSLSAAGLAQVNARVRKLDIDISRLAEDLASARQALALANERAQRAEALAVGQRDTLVGLIPKVDSLQAAAGDANRINALEGRLDKVSNDIRSLYRMLEMGR